MGTYPIESVYLCRFYFVFAGASLLEVYLGCMGKAHHGARPKELVGSGRSPDGEIP